MSNWNRGPHITYSTKGRFKESNLKAMQPDESDLRRGEIRRRIEDINDQRELKRLDEWS